MATSGVATSGTESQMTAFLALLAVLVPASVTFVGYLFAQEAGRRSDQEHQRSEQRLCQEHDDEVARLRLDAAMRAAALFGSSPESTPNPVSSASGLLALTQLDQADLAVALLVDLWSGDAVSRSAHVSDETAVLVISEALRARGKPAAQLVASELLCRNSGRLDPCQSLHWPAAVDGCWIPELVPKAKVLIIEALVRMTFTSKYNENALRSLVVRLYAISVGDDSPRVKGCVGKLIASLVPALELLTYREFMAAFNTVSLDEIRCAAALASPNPDGYLEKLVAGLSATLFDWSSGPCPLDSRAGELATAF